MYARVQEQHGSTNVSDGHVYMLLQAYDAGITRMHAHAIRKHICVTHVLPRVHNLAMKNLASFLRRKQKVQEFDSPIALEAISHIGALASATRAGAWAPKDLQNKARIGCDCLQG